MSKETISLSELTELSEVTHAYTAEGVEKADVLDALWKNDTTTIARDLDDALREMTSRADFLRKLDIEDGREVLETQYVAIIDSDELKSRGTLNRAGAIVREGRACLVRLIVLIGKSEPTEVELPATMRAQMARIVIGDEGQ